MSGPHRRFAIPLVMAAVALFAFFDSTIKLLGGLAPLCMVLWARYGFQSLSTLLTAGPRQGLALFHTRRPGLQLLRGCMLLLMSALAFLSLRVMPVGEFTAIVMLTPLLITWLAQRTLGEQVSPLRWALLLGGMAGALLVIQPQNAHFDLATLLPLGLVVTNAVFQILTGRLARSDDPGTTHLYTGLTGFIGMSLWLPWQWQTLDGGTWALMGLAALLSSAGHYLLIMAYMRAPAATLTPFLYFQVVFGTLAGWLVFQHLPVPVALAGIACITVCGALGTWLTAREAARQPVEQRPQMVDSQY